MKSLTTIIDGWLTSAERHYTSHCDERPDVNDVSLIVVHCISLPPGEFGGDWIDRLFDGSLPRDAHPYFEAIHALRVSAHVLVHRDGRLIQYVPFHKRAWHAGISSYQGRERCNDFSIGIELEGTESIPYSPIQYLKLADIIRALIACYPKLSVDKITGHSDIAPGRKTDPGDSFDWDHLRRLVNLTAADISAE